ncbi:hypothetical protein KP509_30G070600 [Ceratopteris richardii]|uniref:Uncharacterized protein n=1 Tax=Ceratopteris richardii TaxID=49495 RepID=A0A8T2R3K7_CERRI|nr:hypothetical protein KP509_30G070600 [Ceratopteris richardii]
MASLEVPLLHCFGLQASHFNVFPRLALRTLGFHQLTLLPSLLPKMMKVSASLLCRLLKQNGESPVRLLAGHSSKRLLSTSALPSRDSENHESERMMSEGGGSTTNFGEKKEEMISSRSDPHQASKDGRQGTQDYVADLPHKAKNKLDDAMDTASKKSGMSGNQMKETLNKTKDTIGESMNSMSEKGKQMSSAAEDAGKENAGATKQFMERLGEQVKKEVNTSSDMMKDMKEVPHRVSETAHELKEVAVEAGKAVKRDASRLAEKVGIKKPLS